jgi:gamma-glutamylcyclotransferase (GGCT)/AIG2-like uncharacterized protein YtfP
MLPEVMELVAGRTFAKRAALLRGYQRRLVRGEVFPALVPAVGETVTGVLWEGLDAAKLARIDRFEGAAYERPRLVVETARGEARDAFVYLLRPEHHALASDASWDEADFRERHLAGYLALCRVFAREEA